MVKALTVFILNLIPCLVFAQEEWTAKDSIKLSKMLDGEIPIHINDAIKKELEQSFTGSPMKNSSNKLNDFINHSQYCKPDLNIQYRLLPDSAYRQRHESMKFNELRISSDLYTNNPLIRMERNTNLSIPLGRKLYFNIYGNYTLDRKRSVLLPATSISYTVGAGFSYNINKHITIKSQTNYQYNLIKKRWEWFFGAGVTYSF